MSSMKDMDEKERAVHAEQAAAWFVMNQADLPEAEREAFIRWIQRSRQHVEEYLGVASVARDLRKVRVSAEDFALDELIARAKADNVDTLPLPRPPQEAKFAPRPAMRWVALAAGLATLGVLGFYGWSAWNGQRAHLANAPGATATREGPLLAYRTAHGQQLTVRLPDGFVVRLNTDTAIGVHYSATQRDVTVLRGQANFEVLHDPRRAFTVTAGRAEVTDIGTKFDVNLENDATVVTVVEGVVEVVPARERPEDRVPGVAPRRPPSGPAPEPS